MKHFQQFNECTSALGDVHLEIKANEELAVLKNDLGCYEESLVFFLNLRRLAVESDDMRALVRAELGLGRVYDKKVNCEDKAKHHCNEAYQISRDFPEWDEIKKQAGLWCAISQAHYMMNDYLNALQSETKSNAFVSLLEWKSVRHELPKANENAMA